MVYVIPEGNRIMRRVTDDNICIRHCLHHSASCHTLLKASDLTLNLGISFHLLILFLDFLFRHLDPLLIGPTLIEVVKTGNRREYKPNPQNHAHDLFQDISK